MSPLSSASVPIREHLLRLVAEFVAQVRALPGVHRIALIGSLTTPKTNPKDADLLVTIDDTVDLLRLATFGRRLQGRAQSLNHGADIFLATVAGAYLGRTCRWKQCAPGLRLACDARHCGRRPGLHDDLDDIELKRALIEDPPVELWPVPRFHSPPLEDVATILEIPTR